MSRKPKLEKYSELGTFPNVIQVRETATAPLDLSHRWSHDLCRGATGLALEVGCGTGGHTLAMARRNPGTLCVGLDIKGNRLWQGARLALDERIENAIFVRMRAEYIGDFFPENTFNDIWVTFPDPHGKKGPKSAGRRLTSPRFIDIYRSVMRQGGCLHVKTDDPSMYDYSIASVRARGGMIIQALHDLYASGTQCFPDFAPTDYEQRYISEKRPIKYLKCSF